MSLKTCRLCGESRPIESFRFDLVRWGKHRQYSKRYRRHECASCRKKVAHEYARTPIGKFSTYRRDAKRRGIEFSITPELFKSKWGKPCFYCGGDISLIGLDRVNNDLGYVDGNVVSCCRACNAMKSAMGVGEFYDRCDRVVIHRQRKAARRNHELA